MGQTTVEDDQPIMEQTTAPEEHNHDEHWHTDDTIEMAQIIVPLLIVMATGYFAMKKFKK